MNLISALEETALYVSGSDRMPEEISEDEVARQNAESLAQLEGMMRGVRR